MAKSKLETKMDTTEPSGDAQWSTPNAAVEVLWEKLDAIQTALPSSPAAPAVGTATRVSSVAYAASLVIKASAGTLLHVRGYNSGPQQWIQLFNAAALPANTAVPISTALVGAMQNFSLDIPITGETYSTGIVVGNSTTGPTLTTGAADCYFTADRI